MKTIKFAAIIASFVFAMPLLGQSATAQPHGREGGRKMDPERAEKMLERLTEYLDLSETQVEKIKELNEAHQEEMKAIFEEMKDDREEMRKTAEEKRKSHQEKIKETLNDEQKEKYEKMLEMRKERMGEGRENRRENKRGKN